MIARVFRLRSVLAVATVVAAGCVATGQFGDPDRATASSSGELVANPGIAAFRLSNERLVVDVPPPPPEPAAPTDAVATVIALTNAERAAAGLAPVGEHPAVTAAARAHSEDQAAMLRMTHTGSDGSNTGTRLERAGYDWRTWAENVAMGYPSGAAVMEAWMGSAGHRANILNAAMVHIGVAVVTGSDGAPYWTMVLAA